MTLSADDRLDIIDTVNRWSHVADGSNAAAIAAVVTDDAVFEISGAGTKCEGRAAIEAHLAAEMASRGVQTRRHVRNTVFDGDTSSDRTNVRSYYLLTAVGDRGLAKAIAAGEYHDALVRTPEGWRINRRVAHPDGAPGDGIRA